jgi:hypothetical protein
MKAHEFVIESDGLEVYIRRDRRKGPGYDGFLIESEDGYVRVNMEILEKFLKAAVLLEQS